MTPVASVMEAVFQVMTWLGVGIGGVEIARKLWVIDDIYRNRIEISVLQAGSAVRWDGRHGCRVRRLTPGGTHGVKGLGQR